MNHRRSLKTRVIGKSLRCQGAFLVTSFQVFRWGELETSRGGAEKESNQPPRIQSWSLKTASPLESRGCHAALPVTLTQSGGGASPTTEAGDSRKTDRKIDPLMVLVPLRLTQ